MDIEEMIDKRKEIIDKREEIIARVGEKIKEVVELVEINFIKVEDRYGFEQMLADPSIWGEMNVAARQEIVMAVGFCLGVDLISLPEEQIIRKYHEEGVKGELSESGAEVMVMKTNNPQLTIHVLEYVNPELGTRYDFVRES